MIAVDEMEIERTFSPLRVAAAIQVGPAGLTVWFIFNTGRFTCSGSSLFADFILAVLTLTCVLHLAAIVFERKGRLIAIPILFWFVVGMIIAASVH